jgi:uncharacterized protein (TIGR02285 family)
VRIGLIIAGLFYCHSGHAVEVTWLKTDWPPHQITSGVYQEQGTFDLLQQQIVTLLPQITHHAQIVNLQRMEQSFLQTDKNVCSFGSIFTDKRAISRWYSKSVAVLPGLAVHFRSGTELEQHPALQADDSVDVRKLAQDIQLTGAYQPNRFYPPSVLDATTYVNFIPHEFTSQVNAAALLVSKRVDYVIEYPERMTFYLQQNNSSKTIRTLAVADASPYVESFITCNKSPEAPQIIEWINAALVVVWQAAEYKQAMFTWVSEQHKNSLEPVFASTQRRVTAQQ